MMPTDVLERGTQNLCATLEESQSTSPKALGFGGDKKSNKPDGRSSGWGMEETLGTERDKETHGTSTEGGEGLKETGKRQ